MHPNTFVAFDPVFDQPLFTIIQRVWSLHIQFDMCVIIFSTCDTDKRLMSGSSTVHNSLSDKEESLKFLAGLSDRHAEVLHDGQVVARIRKGKVDPSRLVSALSYIITVSPGGESCLTRS